MPHFLVKSAFMMKGGFVVGLIRAAKSKLAIHALSAAEVWPCDFSRRNAIRTLLRLWRSPATAVGGSPLRHRFGRGMGSPDLQEPRQQVRVRPLRALARRRRDRLIDLDAAEPAVGTRTSRQPSP
jgi:hypothetical protein